MTDRAVKLTEPQRALLSRLLVGPQYGSGPVQSALVRKGLAKHFGHGAGTEITEAGRRALEGLTPPTP
jgi:hypothetical protein